MSDDKDPRGIHYILFAREQEAHEETRKERDLYERIVKIILDEGYVCGKAWKDGCNKECFECLTKQAIEQLTEEGLR